MTLVIKQEKPVIAEMGNGLQMEISYHSIEGDLYFQSYAVIEFAFIHSCVGLISSTEVTLANIEQKEIVKSLFVKSSTYSRDAIFFSNDEAISNDMVWTKDHMEQEEVA